MKTTLTILSVLFSFNVWSAGINHTGTLFELKSDGPVSTFKDEPYMIAHKGKWVASILEVDGPFCLVEKKSSAPLAGTYVHNSHKFISFGADGLYKGNISFRCMKFWNRGETHHRYVYGNEISMVDITEDISKIFGSNAKITEPEDRGFWQVNLGTLPMSLGQKAGADETSVNGACHFVVMNVNNENKIMIFTSNEYTREPHMPCLFSAKKNELIDNGDYFVVSGPGRTAYSFYREPALCSLKFEMGRNDKPNGMVTMTTEMSHKTITQECRFKTFNSWMR